MYGSGSIPQDEGGANAWSVFQVIFCDGHFLMGNCDRMKKTKAIHIHINYYIKYQQTVWLLLPSVPWSTPLHCS